MGELYELFIGRRYLRSTRGNRFISFISVTSMAGVALGVAVLLVVLSVMNGFEAELRGRILSMTSHATISAFGAGLSDWQELEQRVRTHRDVLGAAPYIEDQGMLIAGHQSSGAVVQGVLPAQEKAVSQIAERMQAGSFDALVPGKYGIVLGSELAKELHVTLGDHVVMVIAQGSVTAAGVIPRMRRFEVVGIFAAGMYEYDRNFAYIELGDAAKLYRMGDQVSGLRLRLDDLFRAPSIVRQSRVRSPKSRRQGKDWRLR